MNSKHRPLWLYPLFQIPLIALGICLVLAAMFWLLGLGRPNVAVAIALDLSGSTYEGNSFNAPNTVMAQEVTAVKSYVQQNIQQLKTPNEIYVLGFGDQVIPLTNGFTSDVQKLNAEFDQALANANLPLQIGNGTNLNLAIEQGTIALQNVQNRCRELLLVTDGVALVSESAIQQAVNQTVRINAVVIGYHAPALQLASAQTRGVYLVGQNTNLSQLFLRDLFSRFNSNSRWIILWLGMAWIAFMWLMTLPFDRWIFQDWLQLPMNLSGQLSLGNALFWSVLTPFILWQLWHVLGLPFLTTC